MARAFAQRANRAHTQHCYDNNLIDILLRLIPHQLKRVAHSDPRQVKRILAPIRFNYQFIAPIEPLQPSTGLGTVQTLTVYL